MREQVTTYHLELAEPERFRPAKASRIPYEVRRAHIPVPELSRFLYASVGADWRWYMRLFWSYEDWERYLNQPDVGTWIAYVEDTPAGYFELRWQRPRSVEIVYFGLLPRFIGEGLGGALLNDAVRTAWAFGNERRAAVPGPKPDGPSGTHPDVRVWLHTCTLDHPRALENYQARGFEVFKVEETVDEVPDGPMDPWPGADRVGAEQEHR